MYIRMTVISRLILSTYSTGSLSTRECCCTFTWTWP